MHLRFIFSYCLIGLLTGMVFPACDLLAPEDPPPTPPEFTVPQERLLALTAVYAETDSNGAPIQRIVLVDADNPSSYTIITKNNHASIQPRFAPDKQRLIFGDRTTGAVHAPQLVLCDIAADTLIPLYLPDLLPDGRRVPLGAPTEHIVWNSAGTGFYFTNPQSSFSLRQDVLFYDLTRQEITRIHDGNGYSTYPIGLKGADTLIVFSNEAPATGHPTGFYFMDVAGNYLARIQNPHLELINRNGINKKVAYHPRWSDDHQLLVMAYHDSTFVGYKIVVANLDGSYYREYTSGEYIDDFPEWGPAGTVVFDRVSRGWDPWTAHQVMRLNLETGAVYEFVDPAVIDGAVGLRFPAY